MTTVSPVAGTQPASQSTAAAPASETGSTVIDSDFQTFLVMLTTQLQNQDPLNPMEASDFAVQLATFAGVEQQVKSNDLLESIQGQLGQMSMTQLAGWVGMEARATAPAYFDGTPVTLTPDPAIAADRAEIVVYNAAGAAVDRRAIPLTGEPVAWAGRRPDGSQLPAGLYTFRLESFAGSELLSDAQVDVYAEIVEARSEGGKTLLVLEGGTEIASEEVLALRKPSDPFGTVQNAVQASTPASAPPAPSAT